MPDHELFGQALGLQADDYLPHCWETRATHTMLKRAAF